MEIIERNTSLVTLDICYFSQNSSVIDEENTQIRLKHSKIVSLIEISVYCIP